jgi:hypothetical protein
MYLHNKTGTTIPAHHQVYLDHLRIMKYLLQIVVIMSFIKM